MGVAAGALGGAVAAMCLNRALGVAVEATTGNTAILESTGNADMVGGALIGGYIAAPDLTESEEDD